MLTLFCNMLSNMRSNMLTYAIQQSIIVQWKNDGSRHWSCSFVLNGTRGFFSAFHTKQLKICCCSSKRGFLQKNTIFVPEWGTHDISCWNSSRSSALNFCCTRRGMLHFKDCCFDSVVMHKFVSWEAYRSSSFSQERVRNVKSICKTVLPMLLYVILSTQREPNNSNCQRQFHIALCVNFWKILRKK